MSNRGLQGRDSVEASEEDVSTSPYEPEKVVPSASSSDHSDVAQHTTAYPPDHSQDSVGSPPLRVTSMYEEQHTQLSEASPPSHSQSHHQLPQQFTQLPSSAPVCVSNAMVMQTFQDQLDASVHADTMHQWRVERIQKQQILEAEHQKALACQQEALAQQQAALSQQKQALDQQQQAFEQQQRSLTPHADTYYLQNDTSLPVPQPRNQQQQLREEPLKNRRSAPDSIGGSEPSPSDDSSDEEDSSYEYSDEEQSEYEYYDEFFEEEVEEDEEDEEAPRIDIIEGESDYRTMHAILYGIPRAGGYGESPVRRTVLQSESEDEEEERIGTPERYVHKKKNEVKTSKPKKGPRASKHEPYTDGIDLDEVEEKNREPVSGRQRPVIHLVDHDRESDDFSVPSRGVKKRNKQVTRGDAKTGHDKAALEDSDSSQPSPQQSQTSMKAKKKNKRRGDAGAADSPEEALNLSPHGTDMPSVGGKEAPVATRHPSASSSDSSSTATHEKEDSRSSEAEDQNDEDAADGDSSNATDSQESTHEKKKKKKGFFASLFCCRCCCCDDVADTKERAKDEKTRKGSGATSGSGTASGSDSTTSTSENSNSTGKNSEGDANKHDAKRKRSSNRKKVMLTPSSSMSDGVDDDDKPCIVKAPTSKSPQKRDAAVIPAATDKSPKKTKSKKVSSEVDDANAASPPPRKPRKGKRTSADSPSHGEPMKSRTTSHRDKQQSKGKKDRLPMKESSNQKATDSDSDSNSDNASEASEDRRHHGKKGNRRRHHSHKEKKPRHRRANGDGDL